MTVALIGDGGMAEVIARKLGKGSYNILLGCQNEHPMLCDELFREFNNIQCCSIDEAAMQADLVILATPQDGIKEAAYLLDDVRDKVIIDMSALYYTSFGNYFNTLHAIGNITSSPYVVKCYGSDGFKSLVDPFQKHNTATLHYVSNSRKAKELLKFVAIDLGFDKFEDMGSADAVPELDKMASQIDWLVNVKH